MSGGNVVFNVAKGGAAEKVHDDPTKIGLLLLKVVESDANLIDRTTIADVLAHSTEADFTGYARKTGITATETINTTLDRAELDIPDQTWTAAGGATNNALVKAVFFYDEGGSDATRIPLTAQSFDAITDGSDLTAQVTDFFRAS